MGRGVTIFYIHIIWFFDIHIIYIHHHQASSSSGSSLPGSPVARTMGLIHGLGQGLPLGRWVAWTSTGIQSVNGHWIKKQLEHGWTMLNIGNKGSIWNNNKSYICVYIYIYMYIYIYICMYIYMIHENINGKQGSFFSPDFDPILGPVMSGATSHRGMPRGQQLHGLNGWAQKLQRIFHEQHCASSNIRPYLKSRPMWINFQN